MDPLLIVYLDAYHLGDPLFLDRFAQTVRAREGPLLLLHGTGEAAERALEAEGLVPAREGGVLRVEGTAQRALVERAARDLNRRIVHALNEAGVSALRLTGTERGLLRAAPDGAVTVGRTAWLRALPQQGVVPVVALLAEREGDGVEPSPGGAAAALAQALAPDDGPPPVVAVFARAAPRDGADAAVAAPEVAERVRHEGVRVRVIQPSALRGTGVPEGSDLPAAGGSGAADARG